MKKKVKTIFWITFGVFLMCVAIHYFLAPNQLAAGGVSGLAIIINYVFPQISVGTVMIIGNGILFILGYLVFGRRFGLLTLYATMAFAFGLSAMEKFLPVYEPLVDDMLMNVLLGAVIQGIGLAFVFQQNASTGGTDVISMMINRYFHIDMGKSVMISDLFVLLFAAISISLSRALYSLVTVVILSFTIDYAVGGSNRRISMTIISSEYERISRYITGTLDRGCTIYQAIGGYSKEERYILVTIVPRQQYILIKRFISDVDPRAFVFIKYVTEVIGEGFTYESQEELYQKQLANRKEEERKYGRFRKKTDARD